PPYTYLALSCPRPSVSRPIRQKLISSVFFFSSRRRHTRFSRDWSSDVCSSDLHPRSDRKAGRHQNRGGRPRFPDGAGGPHERDRSEERRVGKECRSRWAAANQKKKKKEIRGWVGT